MEIPRIREEIAKGEEATAYQLQTRSRRSSFQINKF